MPWPFDEVAAMRRRRRINETVAALVAEPDGGWWAISYLFALIRVEALDRRAREAVG